MSANSALEITSTYHRLKEKIEALPDELQKKLKEHFHDHEETVLSKASVRTWLEEFKKKNPDLALDVDDARLVRRSRAIRFRQVGHLRRMHAIEVDVQDQAGGQCLRPSRQREPQQDRQQAQSPSVPAHAGSFP